MLWHLRLENVNERGLVEHTKKGLIGSEQLNKLDFLYFHYRQTTKGEV